MRRARANSPMSRGSSPPTPIVKLTAPFFVERFASMRWSILTPAISARIGTAKRCRSARARLKGDAPSEDALEEHWRTYYAHIFNPARLKIGAMKREMPMRYWANLPEASLIAPLVRDAATRERDDGGGRARRQSPRWRARSPDKRHEDAMSKSPQTRRARASRAYARRLAPAPAAPCGSLRPRPSSAKGRARPNSSLWASSRATWRIWKASRSSVRLGPSVRPRLIRNRARSRRGLRDECGEALQVRAARQAPSAQVAQCRRDQRLPLLARTGGRAVAPGAHRSRWARARCAASQAGRFPFCANAAT